MGRRNKNTFSKALGHLKSRSIDEKLQMLSERPTNSAVNYMTINPSTPNADFVSSEIGQQNAGREGQPDFSIGENPETQAESYDTSGLFLADGTEQEVLTQPFVMEKADAIKLTGLNVRILISMMEIT